MRAVAANKFLHVGAPPPVILNFKLRAAVSRDERLMGPEFDPFENLAWLDRATVARSPRRRTEPALGRAIGDRMKGFIHPGAITGREKLFRRIEI